jgi:hypothetical protein
MVVKDKLKRKSIKPSPLASSREKKGAWVWVEEKDMEVL